MTITDPDRSLCCRMTLWSRKNISVPGLALHMYSTSNVTSPDMPRQTANKQVAFRPALFMQRTNRQKYFVSNMTLEAGFARKTEPPAATQRSIMKHQQ